jgi:carbon-monoxide dehydrogenase small subunit
MILTALQILQRNPDPTDTEIRHGIDGNLCRCTGYQHIVNSIRWAAKKLSETGRPAIPGVVLSGGGER